MERSLMQQSALRTLQSSRAISSGSLPVSQLPAGISSKQMCLRCERNCFGFTFHNHGSGDSEFVWKLSRMNLNGGSSEKRGTSCRSSGGSRRDNGKIVARTQKRRARHVKGVTPTKTELFDELKAEEEADEHLERFEAIRAADDRAYVSDYSDESSESDESSDESNTRGDNAEAELDKEPPFTAEIENDYENSAVEEFAPSGENAYTIKYFPDGKKSNVRQGVRDSLEDVSNIVQETANVVENTTSETGEVVKDDVEDALERTGEVAGEVGDIVQETGEDVSATVQGAVEEAGQTLKETQDEVINIVDEGTENLGTAVDEVVGVAQDTAQDVAKTVEDTGQEVGKCVDEAAGAVWDSLEDVGNQGRKTVQEGANIIGEQVQERQVEVEENLEKFGSQTQEFGEEISDRAAKVFGKLSEEVGKSSQNVQESLSTLAKDTANAAEVIRSEAFRLGEVVLTTAEGEERSLQNDGGSQGKSNPSSASIGPGQGVKGKQETESSRSVSGYRTAGVSGKQENGTKYSQPDGSRSDDKDLYIGLKVTVAGAAGRTGKLLVQELISKGVSVTALVRDRNKAEARDLAKLPNVDVVEVDLYKYEAVKKALGDSNAVICAVGTRSFAFDPVRTYLDEFEGVKNLVAAAKNKGDVKKIVFVTTVGVTFLQIVPLIFWKKQAELYLQRSGLDYTIVRPGGLTNESGRGGISFRSADSQFGGSISRQKVAEVCVAALVTPEASEKIVEVVSGGEANRSFASQFGRV